MSPRSRPLSVREAARIRAVAAVLIAPGIALAGVGRGDLIGWVIAGVGILALLVTLRFARRSRWWTA